MTPARQQPPGAWHHQPFTEGDTMAKSSKSGTLSKPARLSAKTTAKPYSGFPLTAHPTGRWCKKIRGKLHYFGKLDSPEAALERFNREWPYLKDGRTPPPIDTGDDGCTVRLLCNAFLTSKKTKVDTGELSARSFQDYYRTCELLIDGLGRDKRVDDLRPDDFERFRSKLAETRAVVALKNEVNRCRGVLKYAFDQRLIKEPVHFGQSFDRPSAKTLRKARHAQGARLFNVDEVTRILAAADVQLKAMTLLGLNCGLGNTDCATLPQSAVDLAGGWIDFPRPKTGTDRRIPLWPETVKAVRAAIAARPEPKDPADAGLVFLNSGGRRWVRVQAKRRTETGAVISVNALSVEFAKLLKSLGINSHRNFYTLRHNFETHAGESKDQVAVDAIMGHVDPSMGAVYREQISDARRLAVVNVVHTWAFPPKGAEVK
jgi:integrase